MAGRQVSVRRIGWVVAGCTLLALLGAAGFLWSGFYNIAATSPHLDVTRWLLEVGMARSVEFHARDIRPPPDLDDPALIERGLRHFVTACANCHGEIGTDQFGQQLLPVAPPLSTKVDEWSPAELFWIVKHGIKMTGMPSWEAQGRDDEVWALVAVLRKLPELSDAALDRATMEGDVIAAAGPPSQTVAACARCHRLTGEGSPTGAFPRLSYQDSNYLFRSLQQYASGERPSGIMAPVARMLTVAQMKAVAKHYATTGPADKPEADARADDELDPLLLQQGGVIAASGDAARGIPPCVRCHGSEGLGTPDAPALAGQYRSYLTQQLLLWKFGLREQSPDTIMAHIGRALTAEEIRAVATYFSALQPRRRPLAEHARGLPSTPIGERE